MLRRCLGRGMYGCERAVATKNPPTLFTTGVSLKEIASLQGDRIKSVQIIKSWHFTTLAVCVGTVISLWALGPSEIYLSVFFFLLTRCRRLKARYGLIYFRCLSNEITGLACSLSQMPGRGRETWFVVLICGQQRLIDTWPLTFHSKDISLKSVCFCFSGWELSKPSQNNTLFYFFISNSFNKGLLICIYKMC